MDEDQFELLARRLSDEVRDKVQAKLFRTYVFAGAAALAAFAYANWDFVEDTKEEVRANAEETVATAIKEATKEIDDLKDEVTRQTTRLEVERERADALRAEVANKLSQLGVEAANLGNLSDSVSALEEERRNVRIDLDEVKRRTDNLAELGRELQALAEKLQKLDTPNAASYDDLISNVEETRGKIASPERPVTVYLQFAGGTRERAKTLAARLEALGYLMPGEERRPEAAGRREIRFFHDSDAAAANALKSAVEQALADLGASPWDVTVKDFTANASKTNPGTIELWVEI